MAVDTTSARKAQQTQIAVVVLGALALGVLYWQFLYAPLDEKRQELEQTHARLSKENRDLKQEERVQSAMLECKPELDALGRRNELMLPADSEPVAFLKVLTNLAGAAGLAQGPTKKLAEEVVTAPPPAKAAPAQAADEEEVPAEEKPCWEKVPGLVPDKAGAAGFVRVPFEIEVSGTFHQLTKYFWLIHQHARSGRIISIEDLTLKDPRGTADGVVLTARFVAVGFREEERPEAAKGAAGAAAATPSPAAGASPAAPGGAVPGMTAPGGAAPATPGTAPGSAPAAPGTAPGGAAPATPGTAPGSAPATPGTAPGSAPAAPGTAAPPAGAATPPAGPATGTPPAGASTTGTP